MSHRENLMSFPPFLRPEADAYLRGLLDAEQYARYIKLALGEGEQPSISLDTHWESLPDVPDRAAQQFQREGVVTLLDIVTFGLDFLKGAPTTVRTALTTMHTGTALADRVLEDVFGSRGWSLDDLAMVRQFVARAKKQ